MNNCTNRFALALLCLALSLSLCACNGQTTPETPVVTLPPAEVSFVAPVGDAALEYTEEVTLFLPRHDGLRLVEEKAQINFSPVRPYAESVVRALLAYTGNEEARAVGGDVKLTLYGTSPVEVSRNVVTVNLGASALQLDRKDFYVACQSITNTLVHLQSIQHVNILVAGKAIGLDIGNTLPMGSLTENPSQDLSAVYAQLLSRRPSEGETVYDKAFSADVTLYFPLASAQGMVAENRTISFSNLSFPDMVVTILRQLAAGPEDAAIDSPELPLLGELLTSTPTLVEESTGGQTLKLSFAHNLDDMLEAYGLSRQQSMASLCYTLCTFFPNLSGLRVTVDGAAVDPLLLTEDTSTSDQKGDPFLRASFEDLLYDYVTLYLADESQTSLCRIQRPIPCYQSTSPRVLLKQLSLGPQPSDSVQGLTGLMAEGSITDTTLLGLSLVDGALLVNFSPAFAEIGQGLSETAERLLAYGLVNTLCVDRHVSSVCFFQSGAQFDGFGSPLYWRGVFYPLPDE